MEKRKSMNYKKLLTGIVIFLVFLLGILQIIDIGLYFIRDKSPKTREISIAESMETMGKMERNYIASVSYSPEYLSEFKKLDIPLSKDEQEFLFILSKDYGISYPLLLSLIETESNFDKNEISETKDYGLMQINIVNHEWLKEKLGFQNILDPYNNIRSGTYILSNLFDKYPDEREVLMAYNMGEMSAKKLWDKGIFDTKYSNKVLSGKVKYELLLK